MSEQLTKEQALQFAKSEVWKTWTPAQLAKFQLYQNRLCIPFDTFHKAMEEALGRPVWTHEFAVPETLKLELEGIKKTPTMEEILNLIPKDKLLIVLHDSGGQKNE